MWQGDRKCGTDVLWLDGAAGCWLLLHLAAAFFVDAPLRVARHICAGSLLAVEYTVVATALVALF